MNKKTIGWMAGAVAVVGVILAWGVYSGRTSGRNELLVQYADEQEDIMEDMMEDMRTIPSGNASVNFLAGMIPHHESAIDMAESYLKYGAKNAELKQLAKDIIETQSSEIEQMRRMMEEIEDSGKMDEAREQAYLENYNQMMENHKHMNHGVGKARNVEQAFAEGMIMHHRMALEMAEAIMETTDEPEVRRLAENIKGAQEREIGEMERILKEV